MRFAWIPRGYKILFLFFLLSVFLWRLQVDDPEQFNVASITNIGQKLVLLFGAILVISTIWILTDSWEQQILRKTRSPLVELSRVERFYGGTVFVRRLPRRIWVAANEGDRLIKPAWSFYVRLESREQNRAPVTKKRTSPG